MEEQIWKALALAFSPQLKFTPMDSILHCTAGSLPEIFWACVDVDTRSSSGLMQKMVREMDKPTKEMYNDLDNKLKDEFRRAWIVTRSFQFVEQSKETVGA